MITCKECVNLTVWRSGELAERFGAGYECKKNIIMCPTPDDFCSRAERIKECPKCGERFVKYSNFCPNCGADMREPKGEKPKDFPQAEDIAPTIESFKKVLDNKLIREALDEPKGEKGTE